MEHFPQKAVELIEANDLKTDDTADRVKAETHQQEESRNPLGPMPNRVGVFHLNDPQSDRKMQEPEKSPLKSTETISLAASSTSASCGRKP